jgi:hypothetical protein
MFVGKALNIATDRSKFHRGTNSVECGAVVRTMAQRALKSSTQKANAMLKKYAVVVLATTLMAGPALAQTKPALGASNPTSTGGGSVGYNNILVSTSAQTTPYKPPPAKPTRATPAANVPSRVPAPNLASSRASTGGGSSSYNETLRPQ